MSPSKFMIDGIDRLGKSTLIKNIQERLGYHLVIHYDKPQKLTRYVADDPSTALNRYQLEANKGMFDLLKSKTPIIFDRTHLGEMVYAPLYRGYSGSYVYQMERSYTDSRPFTSEYDVRLILLTSSNTEMLVDDGLSFDPTKKEEEQQMFVNAFNLSSFKNKVIVDVHNGKGGYKTYDEVYNEAVNKRVDF